MDTPPSPKSLHPPPVPTIIPFPARETVCPLDTSAAPVSESKPARPAEVLLPQE